MSGATKVRGHTRNGKPVRGYTQHRSMGDRIANVLRGDDPNRVRKAVALTALLGVGMSIWYVLSTVVTAAEAAVWAVGVMGSLFGLWTGYRYHRRRHPTRYPKPITFSPRMRLHHARARVQRALPMNRYRARRDKFRRKHRAATVWFDYHFTKYEVTRTWKEKGKSRAETRTVRGWKKARPLVQKPGRGRKAQARPMMR